ncbi:MULTISPECIES: UbiH/UbiF family hydroxylase [Rhizobium]|uniref:UbiH/UbiF family hydroxylase n=1 Tax=Rhizobium rhododendri TaxID=2506430 RepID=A0ABY8IK81_9HYPH|nr:MULTISPECIES: UbiH/UbiF family hydroxylase [Rhizobium]MBZ5757978.1 UbiH/UbiF family hydroxylase [Rhizobium sp. VS19-DR96]MBZ5765192.1 UbiH/UbiF family hydroxylase [Rhizobium sp. VS19-DR129.2]MBZ5772735.1 UbiH/UbiF family hydroxylase [Rhizobium sp. VS19-DRK62.2]MBZ5782578.1 UbiH/UbiF family hydroxylase [Rhizobium sp. VS19-DR121]MBZ5800026.1 UbiH/UbiF family hydroxylase [Rhizobium sp. VS19-DR181]
MEQMDITIVGGGPAGMIAAIALGRGGRQVAFVAPAPAKTDRRTTALMDQSIRFLERLGVWQEIAPSTAALTTMQIIDGTTRLLRSPTVAFHSAEIGLEAFGYNMPNSVLLAALAKAVSEERNIRSVEATAAGIDIRDDCVIVTLDTGETVRSDFVVGADGRSSMVRDAADISVKTWSYPQSAMVLNFEHSLPHRNVSTEFHTESGPFTQVPLPGNRSSLVWVQKPDEAARNAARTPEDLSVLVEERMQSLLGKVTVADGVQVWPLSGMTAAHFGKGRAALIGEAAHVFPPIGAQGLNLSLRDIMALTDILCDNPQEAISPLSGDRFDRKRRADILSRTASVDLLNRSLLSDFLPVQVLRAAGLHVLASLTPLRNIVMREGIEPGKGLRFIPTFLMEKLRRQAS